MTLLATLTQDMKVAMRARDKARLSTLRMLISGLKNAEIESRRDLKPAEELAFLATQAKRRRESIDAFTTAGRDDLAATEQAELNVIQSYLPEQLSEDEVRDKIREIAAEVGATSPSDFPKIMKVLMPQLKGRFPGKAVRPLINAHLS